MQKAPKLDAIDLKILAKLQVDGRITNAALADAVGLSQSPCLQRMKRLEEAGIITGYGAHIDLAALGETLTVFTEVTLKDHHREDFARFEATIAGFNEVVECHLISGGYDYLLKFVCKNVSTYQSTIERVLESCDGIGKYFSYIVIKSPIARRPSGLE